MSDTKFDILKFAERLKELMDNAGYNTHSLAKAVFLSPGTISKYRNAKMEPERSTIELLARQFQINPAWLMGYDVAKYLDGQLPKSKTIPFINRTNEVSGYKTVAAEDNVNLCLLVQDNSMINARIFEGDLAYIHKQSSVENGEIAAVIMGNAVTLKRIYTVDNSLIMHSDNPTIPDKIISKKEKKELAILGKVVFVRFEVR